MKEKRKRETDRDTKQSTYNDAKKTEDTIRHELEIINVEKAKLFSQLEAKQKKKHRMEMIRIDNGSLQDELKDESIEIETRYKNMKREVQELQKQIEQKIRERKLLNNDVVTAEGKERAAKAQLQDLNNQQQEQQNKISGCEAESKRLSIIIGNLSKEKEKYGVEASQANAKYYTFLEQVKIKNNLITRLQKKNVE